MARYTAQKERDMDNEEIKADEIIAVGITIKKTELVEMKAAARVDLNGPAVLAMARLGLEAYKCMNICDHRSAGAKLEMAMFKAAAKICSSSRKEVDK